MTKNLAIVGVFVLAVIFGVSYLKPANITIQNAPASQSNQSGQLGAVPTLDNVDNPYTSIGGVQTFSQNYGFGATSSIVCAGQNPYAATSTIVRFSAKVLTGLIGTNKFSFATSSSLQGASSTPAMLFEHSVPSLAQDYVVWNPISTSTASAGKILVDQGNPGNQDDVNPFILRPNEFWQYRIATGTPGVGYYQGTCKITIQKI